LATCPNCGREVKDDYTFCPFCNAPLKKSCPSCKREIEPDFVVCPYCGFNLSSETPARQPFTKGGRSPVLTLVIVLAIAGGLIDILQGLSESTYDYALYLFVQPLQYPLLASALLLVQVAIGVLIIILGISQLFVAFGLVTGRLFSRRYLLRLISLLFLLSLVELALDTVISGMVSLSRATFSFDIFFVLWSLLLLIIVWRYVSKEDEREIMAETGPNPVSFPTESQ
jgi:RNA polymerase subunit RPABC4/transcription elongation factor Spt4